MCKLKQSEATMANVNVTIRIDEDLKQAADELFDDLGMSFTTAVNVFVRQSLREGRIPFEIGRVPGNAGRFDYTCVSFPQAED